MEQIREPVEDGPVADVYADAMGLAVSAFTVTLLYSQASSRPNQPPTLKARIRMSPEHAKVMAILLKKAIRGYEEQFSAQINVPPQVLAGLGISPHDDWL
ncbi:MAG: DUF3467 domain-containing protein [Chloroflexota bacterium]